jgi:hypothetical protein
LSLSIDYEEDTVASKGIVERLQQGATPASAPSTDGVWLTRWSSIS